MSKQETQSVNSLSLSQNRADFISKFQGKNNNTRPLQVTNQGRWDRLYHQSKVRQMKAEQYRKKQLEKREKELFSECTFHPSLTNNPKYNKEFLKTCQTEPGKDYKPDISSRQSNWIQKKTLHIEALKQNETNKELDQCIFTPKTNPRNKIDNTKNFYKEAKDVLEDPESYSMYVKRLQSKRKKEESKSQRKPKCFRNVFLSRLNEYDYRNHELSSRCFNTMNNSRISTVRSLTKPGTPNKFALKQKSKSLRQFNMTKDNYYDYFYTSQKKKTEDVENRMQTLKNEQLFSFEKEIEYGKALEQLHNELFSFRLMKDDN